MCTHKQRHVIWYELRSIGWLFKLESDNEKVDSSNSRGKDGTHVNNLKCTAPMLVILKRRNIALRNFDSGVVEIEVDDRFLCMGPHRRRGCLTTEVFHSLASLIPAASEEGL